MAESTQAFVYMRIARMPKTWIYARVDSTDTTALQVQQNALTAYADRYGYDVVGVTAEHCSGTTMNRQGLIEISGAAEQGLMEVLLVNNLGQLGRSAWDVLSYIAQIEQHGIEVVCTDDISPYKQLARIRKNTLAASGRKRGS